MIGLCRGLFRLLGLRIVVTGDPVPRTGPVIVVSNHASFLDFIFVGLVGRRSGRYVRFLARYDVWHHCVAGPAMTAMRHIPVDRAAPAGAYLEARGALDRGEVVGLFPEAGVSTAFTVRALMPGAMALARETGAPLLLVAVWGPQRIATVALPVSLRRGRAVTIDVAGPISVSAGVSLAESIRELGRQLQAMLERLQRAHPTQPRTGTPDRHHPHHLGGAAPTAAAAAAIADLPRSAIGPTAPDALFR